MPAIDKNIQKDTPNRSQRTDNKRGVDKADEKKFSDLVKEKSVTLDTDKKNVRNKTADSPDENSRSQGDNNASDTYVDNGPRTFIQELGEIESYEGDLPSPLQVMWHAPENDELFKMKIPDSEIRSWVKDASEYHDVPQEIMAVLLQQENNPNASDKLQFLQFGERTLTTGLQVLDEMFFDLVPDKAFGKNIADGSSGFMNMSRPTLRDAAEYTEKVYGKNPMPDDVRYRMLNWDQDTRIPGDDWKADLYYGAAHVRQLIDEVTGTQGYSGPLTLDQTKEVFKRYNGSGPQADKYASDAMEKLRGAANGDVTLYFYEK